MPYVILIRIKADTPSEDHSLKPPLVDKLIDEGRPLQRPDIYLNPYHRKPPLDDGGGLHPQGVSHIGQDSKFKGPAILIQKTIPIRVPPSGLREERLGLLRVVLIFPDVWIIRPGIRHIGTCGRLSKTKEDPSDDLLLIDRIGNGLAYPLVPEPGMLLNALPCFIPSQAQIESHIGIGKRRISVFIEIFLKVGGQSLSCILCWSQAHPVDPSGLKLQKHRGRVRDDTVDISIDIGPPFKVIVICLKDDLLSGGPFGETEWPHADGISSELTLGDILPLKEMFGEYRKTAPAA